MSRSCQRATFSVRGLGVAAQDAGEPGDPLGRDRVALVRHRARPLLLTGAERLARLEDLGALQVADLRRQALEPRARERDGLQQLSVAIARDDLGRDGLGLQVEASQDPALEVRVRRRVRPDGAADGTEGDLVERAPQPVAVARRLHREAGEFDPERRRLGMHAVGAADAQRVHVRPRLRDQRVDEALGAGEHDLAGEPQLHGEGGVEDVARRQPVVDPAAGRAGARAEDVDEGRDVVVGDGLALLHVVHGEGGGADRLQVIGRGPVHLLAGGDLDRAPGLHARVVGPEGAHRRAGVTVDHAVSLSASPSAASATARTRSTQRAGSSSTVATRSSGACGGSYGSSTPVRPVSSPRRARR